MAEKTTDIKEWVDRCIDGPMGLISYEKYEMASRNFSDEVTAAIWIIKCLANPRCEGSEEVLKAIMERREELSGK